MKQSDFHHEVFFYGDLDEFLDGTVPYLRSAIAAGEAPLVAVGPARTEALRGELAADAEAVRFADMESIGRNPARIIPFWRDFIGEHGDGARPVCGIGEPVWPGRTHHELDECRRHERLLNVAFDDVPPWTLLCPYDTRKLPDEELEAAARCHPFVSGNGAPTVNGSQDDSAKSIFAGPLPLRPGDATALDFGADELGAVRALVGAEAERAGLDRERSSDTVTAASELAANSIGHGGGCGTVWVWSEPADLVVEVIDSGLVEEPLIGRRRPRPSQDRGRGLWIANQLCDLVQIRSGGEGTAVRLRIGLRR